MSSVFRPALLSAFLALPMLVGCGPEGLPTVPVEGTVTVDGSPMEGVTVMFSPSDGSGRAASARTDAEGHYVLTTEINGDGALVGSYKVAISKNVTEDDGLPDEVDPDDEASMDAIYGQLDTRKAQKSNNMIADKFGDPNKSGLEATVAEDGENVFDFVGSGS